MFALASTAAIIGLIHSLAPGHWLPVVLLAKGKRWSMRQALVGACIAGSGHIFISVLIGIIAFVLGDQFIPHPDAHDAHEGHGEHAHEHVQGAAPSVHEMFERYSGLALIVFGLLYAWFAYRRHSRCHGHEHHGPTPKKREKAPYAFLFMLGLSPCVAVLPVFGAAAIQNWSALVLTQLGFAFGVLSALTSATWASIRGLGKLDHPILEHYGDVITGFAMALLGLFLFMFGDLH